MAEFVFKPTDPKEWPGRYHRPAGEESVYHVDTDASIEVRWHDREYNFRCRVIMSPAVQSMARAVNGIKQRESGWPGGSFTINEFGQVICAIQNSAMRFLVGEASGTLWFEDPWDSRKRLTLEAADQHTCGDPWALPYLGIKYNLHRSGRIYFWRQGVDGSRSEYPPRQDDNLIRLLRRIRPNGAMSFIVNHYGIVVAKREEDPGAWQAVFVGCIDPRKWFDREH